MMKTILIVAGGMADIPEAELGGKTPLMLADTPSLDQLAKNGYLGTLPSPVINGEVTSVSSLLTLLGYDLNKPVPLDNELAYFGIDQDASKVGMKSPYIVLPQFSGHGKIITTSPVAQGIAKLALLGVEDLYPIGISDELILENIADLTIKRLSESSFIMIYVDSAQKASIQGDYHEKIKAIELIDEKLITPVADFAWKSTDYINLTVVSDHIASWKKRKNLPGRPPAVAYLNDIEDVESSYDKFDEETALRFGHINQESYELMKFLISNHLQ